MGSSTHVKRNFRGRRKGVISRFEVQAPTPKFIKRLSRKYDKILYYTGRAALRWYKQKLNRKYPKKYKKKYKNQWSPTNQGGGLRKRYVNEILKGNNRTYPYRRIGTLRNFANFKIDKDISKVIAGPKYFAEAKGNKGRTRTSKTVPQILNEGGTAMLVRRRLYPKGKGKNRTYARGSVERVKVRYRSFNWTVDMRTYAGKMSLQAAGRIPL